MAMNRIVQYHPPRRAPSEIDGYYDALCTFKETFFGGSERKLVAPAIAQVQADLSSGDRLRLLDVGASDCRNTKKILETTPMGLNGFRLVTVDPDQEALARTPDEITRWHHFSRRFQDVESCKLPTVDIVLFSHSLYYFEDPVEILEQAKDFIRPGGRIVVAIWDRKCDLRTIAGRLAPNMPAPISGSKLFDSVDRVGSPQWYDTWEGEVDFEAWRDSRVVASAAAEVLSPRKSVLDIPGGERILKPLDEIGKSGIRKNAVFTVDTL